MQQQYADQTLIRYVYGECNKTEAHKIKECASNDTELMERIIEFRLVHDTLNRVHQNPSQTSIDIIMEYNRNVKEELEASC